MSKVIAMIPARMGSKRIPKKNIRLLNGKPLIQYAIDAVKDADCFDEIWINSESQVIEKIANSSGVNFYKRPKKFSTDSASNDMWTEDFFKNVGGDIVIQVLPTSPFITPAEIKEFVQTFVYNGYDTLISMASGGEQDWYALSFISYANPARRTGFFLFANFMAQSMSQLFHARPPWGKVCPLEVNELTSLYPRFDDFRTVCNTLDSQGVFQNDWTAALLED